MWWWTSDVSQDSAADGICRYCEQDECTHHEVLPRAGHPEQSECIEDDADEHGADKRCDSGSATTGDAGTPDHHRRDHLQFEPRSGGRLNLAYLSQIDEGGDTNAQPDRDEAEELDATS